MSSVRNGAPHMSNILSFAISATKSNRIVLASRNDTRHSETSEDGEVDIGGFSAASSYDS
jgi:hypothetical protein